MSEFLQAPSSHDRVPADEVRGRLTAVSLVREAGVSPARAHLRTAPAGAGETPLYVVPDPAQAGRMMLSTDPATARPLARVGSTGRVVIL